MTEVIVRVSIEVRDDERGDSGMKVSAVKSTRTREHRDVRYVADQLLNDALLDVSHGLPEGEPMPPGTPENRHLR